MLESEILNSTIKYTRVNSKKATHFAICKRNKIRYFISLKDGKRRLADNLSSYSNKLNILMKMIRFIPFRLLELLKIGYFIEATFCDEVGHFIKNTSCDNVYWNVIVGTYDDKQKIVVQLWDMNNGFNKYYKIGNKSTNKEMLAEMNFLKGSNKYKNFCIPRLIDSQKIQDGYDFNIQLTEEFVGKKVEATITEDIYSIFKEIIGSRAIKYVNEIPYGFSHGDFTPWNMRKQNHKYILFDWEHCGVRFYGFDLIHYIFNIEFRLNGRTKEDAILKAVEETKKKEILLDKISSTELINLYFDEFYGEL